MSWFEQRARENFEKHLKPAFAERPCEYLELGVWKGDSLVWAATNLNNAGGSCVGVDPYAPLAKKSASQMEEAYQECMVRLDDLLCATVIQEQSSTWMLNELTRSPEFRDTYDVIYIDADHYAANVLFDAVLSWRLLKVGGWLIFDDYTNAVERKHHVKCAVDAFIDVHANLIDIMFVNQQVGIVKRRESPTEGV